jgi:hypothetical protein
MPRRAMTETKRIAIVAIALLFAMALVARPAHASFGIAAFDQQITADPAGDAFTQAGGHPYAITTEIDLNSHTDPTLGGPRPDADARDVVTNLPPGEFGNPTALAQCTYAQLGGIGESLNGVAFNDECPAASQVGTIELQVIFGTLRLPLFNMVPPPNAPALFGFNVLGTLVTLSGNIRNGSDFGVTVTSPNIPVTLPLSAITLTFWGTPADPRHNKERCGPENQGLEATPEGLVCGTGHADSESEKAFLTIPGQCTAPGTGMKTTVAVDSWIEPGVWAEQSLFNHLPPGFPLAPSEWGEQQNLTGCDVIPFQPAISVQPTNTQADTPSGLDIEISLPQEGLLNPDGVASADVKQAVVTLPAGESVSPSAASGLSGCSLEQIGLSTNNPAACPDSSKLGDVEIDTPLQERPLSGGIFLGKPECEPCGEADDLAGRLLKLYIVAEGHGVIIKLAGRVELDPQTGRIVTTFDNNPQLPFDHLKLSFKAGPRSPLVNPHACGSYETTAQFTPWSGNAPVTAGSSFAITSGPGGGPCPSSTQRFAPGFAAGTTNNQAGAFSPFSLTFTRADGEQQLGGVSLKLPPGLLGTLAGIPLCGEPQASSGNCSPASEIGSVTAGAGAGANPFYVTGGKVFLTVGYKGAPFGLSIVVPAVAGPFDLGTVIVRAAIAVDPQTAQLTVSTDPLPTILDGIPLDLRTINVAIDKAGFIFNPTDCNPMSLTGTLTGGAGGAEPVSSGFQVTNCAALAFKPAFAVSTSGRPSRANGASLDVKLSYPPGSMGRQANIARVKVDLPKQLPSRLTTLQKACPDTTFDANPAACGPASRVGEATAVTPILPEPLHGPAYFVSHGGAKFPELIVVLSGYGVTVDLDGETFISKQGITSSTFRSVPDVPISSFELKLPQGPNSALAANGNLCTAKLRMPTAFTAQDGAVIDQSTPIAVTGCAKHKSRKTHRKDKRAARGTRGARGKRG